MKKIKYFYIVSGLLLVSILSSATTSTAWKNGKEYVPGVETAIISIYGTDYLAGGSLYYGTHDWIAESALELLYSVRPDSEFLEKLHGNYLKYFFLVGTELPDREYDLFDEGQMIKKQFPTITTTCGYPITKKDFPSASQMYFDPITKYPTYDRLARKADLVYNGIKQAFEAKDCERAALLIGGIMHYIADATFFYHLLEKEEDMTSWVTYAANVYHVTYRTWGGLGDRNAKPEPFVEFFSVAEARNKITAGTSFDPHYATLIAAKDTRFGDANGEFKDANWLYDHAPTANDPGFWEDVTGNWIKASYARMWSYSSRPTSGDAKEYFDTIEHNLNTAIYYAATALNYILDFGGYDDCECLGDLPGKITNPEPRKTGVKDAIGLKINSFQGLMFFNVAGLMSTAIALALLNKGDLLEEFILA